MSLFLLSFSHSLSLSDVCFLFRDIFTCRNKKRHVTKRERERERDDHIFSNRSTRTYTRATVLFFPREEEEEEEEEEEDQKRDFEQLREFCAFFGFSNRERERERETLVVCA